MKATALIPFTPARVRELLGTRPPRHVAIPPDAPAELSPQRMAEAKLYLAEHRVQVVPVAVSDTVYAFYDLFGTDLTAKEFRRSPKWVRVTIHAAGKPMKSRAKAA